MYVYCGQSFGSSLSSGCSLTKFDETLGLWFSSVAEVVQEKVGEKEKVVGMVDLEDRVE